MADRPESSPGVPEYFEWASGETQQLVRIRDRVYVLNNKEPTLPEFRNFGLRYGQPLNFQEINYQLDGMSKAYQHLEQRYAIGSLHRTTSAETDVQISARLGGTWVLLGTESIGGKTVSIWEKTA